jgi:endonuclease G, mitochondrial
VDKQEQRLIGTLISGFFQLSFRLQVLIVVIIVGAWGVWYVHHVHGSVTVSPPTATATSPGTPVTGPCADKVPYGAPAQTAAPATALGALKLICRTGYLVGYSGVSKTPAWVAEHLLPDAIYGKEPRTNNFTEDTSLPQGQRAALADYSRSGYDRGHMAPAADFSRSAQEMSESFFLSNMVPQFPENNRGPWAKLEGHVRSLTKDTKELYVITGPVFPGSGGKTIGANHVAVPSQLFKLAFDPSHGKLGAWLLPNADVPVDQWNKYCTSVQAIEAASGLTFLSALPAEQRNKLIAMSCAL